MTQELVKRGFDEINAKLAANKSKGDFNKAIKIIGEREYNEEFEKLFIEWVRTSFSAKTNKKSINKLMEWSEKISKLGREIEKQFLEYSLEFFRQAMVLNYNAGELVTLKIKDSSFSLKKFSLFISGKNIEGIFDEIEKAILHIERNGNPKIILGDSGGDKVQINGDGDTYFNGGDFGINVSNPSERLHMSGSITQAGSGNNVQLNQTVFGFGDGTHTLYTLSGYGVDATAVAVFEYVCLYAYAGTNHEAGIIYASTRRTNSNAAWNDIDNIAADQAGNDSGIRPNLFWDSGVLKITVGSSVQCTGTLRLTTRRFTVTRNYASGG